MASKLYVPEPPTMGTYALDVMQQKYSHDLEEGRKEHWGEIALRVASTTLKAVHAPKDLVQETANLIAQRKFIPGGRYLYACGRPFHQVQNCLLLRAEDSREGWADLMQKATMALMTGAGIGVDYSLVRAEGKIIRRTGGTSTGPLALMQMVNEAGRGIMQGGSRRAAIWAGLNWAHPDIMRFIHLKDWIKEVRELKERDFSFPATMDMTNISVQLDDEFFKAYHNENHSKHGWAWSVYWEAVEQMLKTGEPGFSIDVGENAGETLRNACTEITSRDDSDICNLGSINLAQISDAEEMKYVTEIATRFLLAGTVYSDVPYPKVDMVRQKNRRIGLGLMGIHEWLLIRGKRYDVDSDLDALLEIYKEVSESSGRRAADEWEISCPIKFRAVAPTGTIGGVAETSTGADPFPCAARKRRYLKHLTWAYQYVIDPAIKRLVDSGVNPDAIEDAYSLAEDFGRRIRFQEHLQKFVDHAISSTVNLPRWGSETNNEDTVRGFGNTLLQSLPGLRGITCYPDGARGGQPIVPVKYQTAAKHVGRIFTEGNREDIAFETGDMCDWTKGGGSCSS